jgi:hypothetical protein
MDLGSLLFFVVWLLLVCRIVSEIYRYWYRYILPFTLGATEASIKACSHRRLVKSVADRVNGALNLTAVVSAFDNEWGVAPDYQHHLEWTKQSHGRFAQLIKQNFEAIMDDVNGDLLKAVKAHFDEILAIPTFMDTEAGLIKDVMADYRKAMELHNYKLKDITSLPIHQSILQDIRTDFAESSQAHRKRLQQIVYSDRSEETMTDVYQGRNFIEIFKSFYEAVQSHEKDLFEIIHLTEICDRAKTKFGVEYLTEMQMKGTSWIR